jgi:hypothetical protein
MSVSLCEITRYNIEEILRRDVDRFKAEVRDFPFNCCSLASRRLCKMHSQDNRFRLVHGGYYGPISPDYRQKYRNSFLGQYYSPEIPYPVSHMFVYDSATKLFIDVTSFQFHSSNPEILLMTEEDERIAYRRNEISEKTTHLVDHLIVNSGYAELIADLAVLCYS